MLIIIWDDDVSQLSSMKAIYYVYIILIYTILINIKLDNYELY